jgi:hypothetical protein
MVNKTAYDSKISTYQGLNNKMNCQLILTNKVCAAVFLLWVKEAMFNRILVAVSIRLYEYWHEQVKIRNNRWNNKEIKKFYWK